MTNEQDLANLKAEVIFLREIVRNMLTKATQGHAVPEIVANELRMWPPHKNGPDGQPTKERMALEAAIRRFRRDLPDY